MDLNTTPEQFSGNLPSNSVLSNSVNDAYNDINKSNFEGTSDEFRLIQKEIKQRGFIHQIRDQLYYIEIWLYNQIESQDPFPVSFMFVHSLAIEESLNDWWIRGWITFNNTFEMFERGNVSTKTPVKAPFTFRSDGRNRISLRLYPISNKETTLASFSEDVLPRDKWEMSYDCVIYDIEDIPVDNNITKLKKCYFWDERYQIFSEKNIEWSTGVQGKQTMVSLGLAQKSNIKPSEMTDIEKAIPANIAIRSIIETASLLDPSGEKDTGNVIKVGYTENGSIDKPNIALNTFDINWDDGPPESDKQNLVLYTSPANANVLDDLEYVMQNAMSKSKFPVFLRFSRNLVQYEDEKLIRDTISSKPLALDKKWSLVSLEEIIKNASRNQVERLFIEDGAELMSTPHIPRAPDDYSGDIINFTSGIASRIKSYKFSPMISLDDLTIHNKPVHSYDFKTGAWVIHCSENTVKNAIDSFTEVAKQGLYSFKQNSDAHLAINLNKTKQKGIIHSNEHITRTFFPTNYSQIDMMKKLLFLNQTVNFTVNGLTIRTPVNLFLLIVQILDQIIHLMIDFWDNG